MPNKAPVVALGDTVQNGPVASLLEPSVYEFEAFIPSLSVIRQTYDECLVCNGQEPGSSIIPSPLAGSPGFYLPFIPARLLCSKSLPVSLSHEDTLNELVGPAREKRSGKYQDFGQFLLNPYLKSILSGRMNYSSWMYQVVLAPTTSSHDLILSPPPAKEVLSLIGPMLATQPPCKVINLYIEYFNVGDRTRTFEDKKKSITRQAAPPTQ
jgi:hypothetical protein